MSFYTRFRNTLLVVLATVFLIAFCFVCIYGLKMYQLSLYDKYLTIEKAKEIEKENYGFITYEYKIFSNNLR